ncbi:MAG TPA: hypothetical protein VFZ20_09505, partial [Longimicrobium sp.]
GGNEAVQRQRYAFAAAFSAGVMMPIGYEFGFRRQVNVVSTMPTDWERRTWDLRPFITRVNGLKLSHPVLQGEGHLRPVGMYGDTLTLERTTDDGDARGWIVINKVWKEPRPVEIPGFRADGANHRLFRVCRDDAPADGEPVPQVLTLDPAEVAYVLPVMEGARG